MNRLLLIGLNHTTAPLAVRERLAFSGKGLSDAVSAIQDRLPGSEIGPAVRSGNAGSPRS